MTDTLAFLLDRFRLDKDARCPVEIRNFGRYELADMFCELGFTCGVEVGVEVGLYSEVLCQRNPNLHLFSIDNFSHYSSYRDHVSSKKLQRFFEEATMRLEPYQATIVRKFSMDAVQDFADNSLDFVYLDANHTFQYLTNDLAEWSKKVRPGGIISGHDYSRYKWPTQIHVVQVLTGWTDAMEISPWFVLGAKGKQTADEVRDTPRSWCWVQPEPRRRRKREIEP